MIQLIKMAYRDLGHNRRRSFLSALALALGLSLLLLMASVVKGEMAGSMDSSIRLNSGHLQVRAETYNEDNTSLAWKDLIENPSQVAAQVASLAPVAVATPRLVASGIVSYADQSLGARVLGIDPPSAANAPFRNGLLSGEFLKADDTQGVLIGQPLAKKIGLKVGDPINLLINTSNGNVDQQTFNVRGIYSTGTPTYDQSTILMPIEKAQAITQTANHASIIFVLLKDRAQTQAVANALKSSLYKVLTFEQMNQILVETEKFADVYMYMLFIIVLGITATVIINTFIMSVYERTREIGILAALGMRSGRIMAMFFAESSLLAVGGIIMGLILGALMVVYATQVGFYIGNIGATGMLLGERIYAQFSLQDAIALTIIAFIVTLLAALYPALLAARMEPVDALRGEK